MAKYDKEGGLMAKDSKTILLFTEQRDAIGYLTDEEAGQMFKAIYDYADEGIVPKFSGPMMSVFAMIRSQIDRSRDAYKEKCLKNSANARKRYASKKQETSERMPSHANANDGLPPHPVACIPNPTPNPNLSPNSNPNIDDGTNASIINEAEMIGGDDYPFDEIWEMYDKQIGVQEQLRQRWNALSNDDKKAIFAYVPLYVQARPDRKYRKDFANFLTCRTWETEPINFTEQQNENNQRCNQSIEARRDAAQRTTLQLANKLIGASTEPVANFDED